MLNCEYCGNVIEGDEKFYIIDDEYYCKNCIIEEQRIIYKVCDEDYYDEDNVVEYESVDEYINTLNNLIKFCDEAIKTNNKLLDDLDDLDDEKKIKYLNFSNSILKENKIKYEKELENFKNLLKENVDK